MFHFVLWGVGCLLVNSCGSSGDSDGEGAAVKALPKTPPEEQKRIAQFYKKSYGGSGKIDANGDVTHIFLNDKTITDLGLANIKKLNALQVLNLRNSRISDVGMQHLATITSIKILVLEYNNITDAGLDHILQMQNLEVLNLSNTKIADKGLMKLDALKSLQRLDIRRTKISPQGLEKFEKQSSVAKNCEIQSDF